MNKILKKLVWLFILAPVVYLITIWKKLPETVAMHFDLNGNPDRYGSKNELWITAALLAGVSAGVYLLTTNLHRIDPKRHAKDVKDKSFSIAITVVIFLTAIHFLIIYSSIQGRIKFGPGFILSAVALLFAILGNYMYNIKPNYFIGMRLPWTLESEDNWKKTHHLAGRLWFCAGIVMAIVCLLLPPATAFIVFFSGTLLITIIPAVYSYRLFAKAKKNK
jgi:uncharacterized membrane protein